MITRSLNVPGSDSSALQIEIVRPRGLPATASHLPPSETLRRRGPKSFESLTSRMTPSGPSSNAAQGRVAAVGPVVVEAPRVDLPDPAQKAQRRVAGLRYGAGDPA